MFDISSSSFRPLVHQFFIYLFFFFFSFPVLHLPFLFTVSHLLLFIPSLFYFISDSSLILLFLPPLHFSSHILFPSSSFLLSPLSHSVLTLPFLLFSLNISFLFKHLMQPKATAPAAAPVPQCNNKPPSSPGPKKKVGSCCSYRSLCRITPASFLFQLPRSVCSSFPLSRAVHKQTLTEEMELSPVHCLNIKSYYPISEIRQAEEELWMQMSELYYTLLNMH